jgi:hypothetical protein
MSGTDSATAQAPAVSSRDSTALVREAEDRQRDFEFFRQSRIPVSPDEPGARCDQRIGRICIWFGGDEEADYPPEPREVKEARGQLVGLLASSAARIQDPWITGQLVHYLAEDGRLDEAEAAARACSLREGWWCSALLGYTLHLQEEFVAAETAFREALAAMPERERERWTTRYVFTRDAQRALERGEPEERERLWNLYWQLSDPLFLADGNDRLTDHLARWVQAHNYREAENPQQMFWEEDLEETLVRYGRILGYSRSQSPGRMMGGGGFGRGGLNLQDTRRVIGHHHPRSRGYLFPDEFLASPSEIVPESWITAPRESRTWYAPPYAPDFNALDTQVGRFWRGEQVLVVGAFRPERRAPGGGDPRAGDSGRGGGSTPAGGVFDAGGAPARSEPLMRGPVSAALFLVPVDGTGEVLSVRGSEEDGVLTLLAPPGRYVSSLEVWDEVGRAAWRARQGVTRVPLAPGTAAVSDLVILEPGAPLPETLDEALPNLRRGVRIRQGERFSVAWEVYGLGVRAPAQVTLGFTRGRPGFLQRVGEFVGILEPDQPVEVSFQDASLEDVQTAFRSVSLQLPDLEPGEYTLHLRVEVPGRDPAVTSRPITVVAGP